MSEHVPPVPPVPPGQPFAAGPGVPGVPGSAPPDQILNQPFSTGDLTAELKQNKRSFGKVTVGLTAAVLLVASFFGGVATHAAIAGKSTPAAAQQNRTGAGRFPGGYGGQGQGGQGGGGQGNFRGGTVGTIDHIDGTDVYVKTPDGRTIKVSTTASTQVRISQQGKVSDLKDGQTIIVQGDTGTDGNVSAQTITQQPARGNG